MLITQKSDREYYISEAVKEAISGVKRGDGGPFGALIVRDNKIIARAHNMVLKSNDPTAHAEITAIRRAARKLKNYDLAGSALFTSSEPCPMCLAAIHWARITEVYCACGRGEAAAAGFDDEYLYRIFRGEANPAIRLEFIPGADISSLFALWKRSGSKVY